MGQWWIRFLGIWFFCLLGCESAEQEPAGDYYASQEALVAVCGGSVRYPTTQTDFARLYNNRAFNASGYAGAHLGHDVDYPVGTPIRPILCGKVVYYGPAGGYGTLVVAIEHTLNRAVSVTNGNGQKVLTTTFLSIYGHLRREGISGAPTLSFVAGQSVSTDQVIGYIQEDALNGDGSNHLHQGIRLQSMQQAQQVDGRYWLRGYDSSPSKRGYYADPVTFLRELSQSQVAITWHPPGAYLRDTAGEGFIVSLSGESLMRISELDSERMGYSQRPIPITQEERGCYRSVLSYVPRYLETPGNAPFVGRSSLSPTVYQFYGGRDGLLYRESFISWEAFLSYGYTADDIGFFDTSEWGFLERTYTATRMARLAEGSLVKARGAPAIYVVSNGVRRPIFNWNTFQAFGYQLKDVYEIDGVTLDAVAGPLGSVLRLEDATRCVKFEL